MRPQLRRPSPPPARPGRCPTTRGSHCAAWPTWPTMCDGSTSTPEKVTCDQRSPPSVGTSWALRPDDEPGTAKRVGLGCPPLSRTSAMTSSSSASAPYGTKRACPSSRHPCLVTAATHRRRPLAGFLEPFPIDVGEGALARQQRLQTVALSRRGQERLPAQHDPPMERGGNRTSPQGLRHDHQVADAATPTTDRLGEADGHPAPGHELGPQPRVVPRFCGVDRIRVQQDRRRQKGAQSIAELLLALRRGEVHHATRGGRGRPNPACAMRVRLISLVPPPIVPCTRSRYSQAKRPSPELVLDAGPKRER